MKTNIPEITIGIDLGDKKHFICVLDAGGEQVESRPLVNTKEAFKRLSKKYPSAPIIMDQSKAFITERSEARRGKTRGDERF